MADAVLADGRATGYARELAAPSADWFLRMSRAAGGLGRADFTGNAGAHCSSVGDYAGDERAVLADKDRVGELVRGEARNTGAGGFARGHVALLGDQDRAGELPLGGVADFVERDMAAPHTIAGGVPFDKAQSVVTAAGAAPSFPNAAQVNHPKFSFLNIFFFCFFLTNVLVVYTYQLFNSCRLQLMLILLMRR